MTKQLVSILLFVFFLLFRCYGQETDTGPGYQMIIMNNPAYTGTEGEGTLRLSYLNFYPGKNYNLHYIFASYDSYFPSMHGGAGFFVSDDYMGGIINDIKAGISYSYFLQAGEHIFINGGLSASVFHRGISFSKAVFPDQIDPLSGVIYPAIELPVSNGRTVFDVGAGFVVLSGKFSGGISVSHLSEPDIAGTGYEYDKLKRKLQIHLSQEISLNSNQTLQVRPLAYLGIQNGYISGSVGAVLEINALSINALILDDNNKNMDIQSGFSIKAGKLCLYYNYRFNIVSSNSFMPLSLIHQTGLILSLNNVDKRNLIKTINFPKM